ncbi:tetratricopeptide repeat protein [Limnofasciculus baicalensis]|uniref:Tetratricopeptide repeat protein n=1 Tax=Limnofasciculus baicalensis BBK-W-15 TaxID=2699891 RepID=A0AAE3KLM8_9CYAN|nr:tetratricopeptide repeat protein [Limnofasciculus baicalensis]MCP2728700.1 tetratricopeptide repeat protein [Limnofasciculus baicalensis BBK-W-15]
MDEIRQKSYLYFLMAVLQATADSKGNPQVVYPLLQANLDKLDLNLAGVLQNWVEENLPQWESAHAQYVVGVIVNFSNLIQQFPQGKRGDNLEIALVGYKIVSTVFTQAAFPENWAGTQINLGNAYLYSLKGEKADNLEMAIVCYGEALKILTPTAFPVDWAITQNNLGEAYRNRIKGEKADNIEMAIMAQEFDL